MLFLWEVITLHSHIDFNYEVLILKYQNTLVYNIEILTKSQLSQCNIFIKQ